MRAVRLCQFLPSLTRLIINIFQLRFDNTLSFFVEEYVKVILFKWFFVFNENLKKKNVYKCKKENQKMDGSNQEKVLFLNH